MSTILTYFNGRGRGEIIRIVLAGAGIEYEEVYITEKQQFQNLKKDGKLLFGQVPILEIDGKTLAQSGAIVRYLARKYNLFGKNDDECVIIDQYYEGTRDFYNGSFMALVFMDEEEVLKKAKEVTMPKYLPIFEKILESSGGQYLVGNALSIADLGLLEALLAIEEFVGLDALDTFPKLKGYYSGLKSLERIENFLSGPHRKKKNDKEYVDCVKHVLWA